MCVRPHVTSETCDIMVAHLKSLRRPTDLGCHPKPLISGVVARLKPAYLWLRATRARASPNADIWDLRRTWAELSQSVVQKARAWAYHYRPRQITRHSLGLVAERNVPKKPLAPWPVASTFWTAPILLLALAWLDLAGKTIRNHRVKLHRLYEQYLRVARSRNHEI